MIDHANGDYFLDCGFASQSLLRAAFGFWINIYVATVAFCVRSIFRSRVTTRLLSRDRKVSLWTMSPATTPSEAFGLRYILLQALRRGHVSYVAVSLFCVAAAIVSAASTTIANHTVVQREVIRRTDVSGRLAMTKVGPVYGLYDRVAERAKDLTRAQAPFDQLFDFMPDVDTNWVFIPEQWNNTWTGQCAFYKYPAVDLVVLNSTAYLNFTYQDFVPALGAFLPPWATLDTTKQGYSPILSGSLPMNHTGACRDCLITYVFGSAPYYPDDKNPPTTTNISLANILLHEIGLINATNFMETAFKSDVHVAECSFNNSFPNEDQAGADGGEYFAVANAVSSVYTTSVGEASAQEQSVVQPTAQEMFRYWQAYEMVEHGYYIHPVHRNLSTSLEVVQIRLSVLVVTVVTFVLALVAAVVARLKEPLDERGQHINLPKSQLDWIVAAASQQHAEGDHSSRLDYAREHQDLFFTITTTRTGLPITQIISNGDKANTQPILQYSDSYSPYDRPGEPYTTATPGYHDKSNTRSPMQYFDPDSLYDR